MALAQIRGEDCHLLDGVVMGQNPKEVAAKIVVIITGNLMDEGWDHAATEN
ncbi:MAG: hypothetical protein KJ069_19890 [Anaerolineae bacterium]|nr:hypothetical protein [Anaerolineae bacterium]